MGKTTTPHGNRRVDRTKGTDPQHSVEPRTETGRRQATRRLERLLLLSLTILLGLIALAVHVLLIVTLALMALLWISMASELGGSRRHGGAISGVVGAVVSGTQDLAREIAEAPSAGADEMSDDGTSDQAQSSTDDRSEEFESSNGTGVETTKKQLYEEAREAGIPGRSGMSKEELEKALQD